MTDDAEVVWGGAQKRRSNNMTAQRGLHCGLSSGD